MTLRWDGDSDGCLSCFNHWPPESPDSLQHCIITNTPDINSACITFYKRASSILYSPIFRMHFEIDFISFLNGAKKLTHEYVLYNTFYIQKWKQSFVAF